MTNSNSIAFFERVPASLYYGGSRIDSITMPYVVMVAALGEPHKNTDVDFPDDNYKVDVCWSVRSTDAPGDMVTFWNYKNGPAYNDGEGSVEDIGYFSVWYSNEPFWRQIQAYISDVYVCQPPTSVKTIDAALANHAPPPHHVVRALGGGE